MNHNNFITANSQNKHNFMDAAVLETCKNRLEQNGFVLLRGFDVDLNRFSELLSHFCSTLTFDPARENSTKSTQKVDAGTDAIGLHIENGNTPFPPDVIAFYSRKSAAHGSQTTLCDGAKLYHALSDEMKSTLSQTLTVSRNLPEHLWKSYAANEHPAIESASDVDASHLTDILSIAPNHRGELNEDGSLHYELDISAVLKSPFSQVQAFANAILGPSFNYETPHYTFADGTKITDSLKVEISDLAESFTLEIPWQDNDIALIDNKRVMHGRREITDMQNRELFIGMGRI